MRWEGEMRCRRDGWREGWHVGSEGCGGKRTWGEAAQCRGIYDFRLHFHVKQLTFGWCLLCPKTHFETAEKEKKKEAATFAVSCQGGHMVTEQENHRHKKTGGSKYLGLVSVLVGLWMFAAGNKQSKISYIGIWTHTASPAVFPWPAEYHKKVPQLTGLPNYFNCLRLVWPSLSSSVRVRIARSSENTEHCLVSEIKSLPR